VNGVDYFGHHGYYAILLQGVVDHDRRFRSIDAGYPGAVTDSRVLRNSNFWQVFQTWMDTIPARTVEIGPGVHGNLAPYVLGDCGYTNRGQFITTYTMAQTKADPDVLAFNCQLAGMRHIVECAFGILKMRFRVLQKLHVAQYSPKNATIIIAALCIVHNFLISHNDRLDDEEALEEERAAMRAWYDNRFPAPNEVEDVEEHDGEELEGVENGVHVSATRRMLFQHAVYACQNH
jgi:hypothetical protein